MQLEEQQLTVHFFSLKHPGRVDLIEQRPKWRNEQVDNAQLSDGSDSFPAEAFLDELYAAARDVYEFLTSGPKGHCRQDHKPARCTESDGGPISLQQLRNKCIGNESAQVYGKIEPDVNLGHEMLIGFSELVTNVGRDARLYYAWAYGDKDQTGAETQARMINGQSKEPKAVDDREKNNGSVFGQPDVGDQRTDKRCEVHSRDEQVKPEFALLRAHRVKLTTGAFQKMGHEEDQNTSVSVEAEALRCLIGENIGSSCGHFFWWDWCR